MLYVGSEPMRLPSYFEEGGTRHPFELINLQDSEASELLASPDWGGNLWALGAKGEHPVVSRELVAKVALMTGEDRESALAELTAFSGILKLDDLLQQKLKEFSMLDTDINLEENAVVRRLLEKRQREGWQKGLQEGRRDRLLSLLVESGALPLTAAERVRTAPVERLDRWASRVLRSSTLDEALH